jgi:GTP cyclohydrolase I
MAIDRRAAADAIDAFLRAIGREESELTGTGARVADMFLDELCSGYGVDTRDVLERGAIAATSASTVVVRDIPVATTCPHHLVPSLGRATVAFRGRDRIVGLGVVVAVVDAYARRLSLQETIGEGVVADLDAVLAPEWVGCRLVLSHACMIARGERATGSSVETIALRAPPEREAEARSALGVGVGVGAGSER